MDRSLFRKHLEQTAGAVLRQLGVKVTTDGLEAKAEVQGRALQAASETEDTGYLAQVIRALPRFFRQCYVYKYPKPDVTTDSVMFGLDLEARRLLVLLIKRGREHEPFYGSWALPGGFLNMDEALGICASRELREETGAEPSYMEQLFTFGTPDRDPRGRVITVAHMALVRPDQVTVKADDDAEEAQWFPVDGLPPLAFDHGDIIHLGLQRLRSKLRWQPLGVDLLKPKFTMRCLQDVYEIILGRPLERRSFLRKMAKFVKLGVLVKAGGVYRGTGGRPAQLFRFDPDAYGRLRRDGLDFEV